ncbi:MAG: TlpA family protein disulfide reductase, partial [Deltaproteobacteria bacterium]|nr:TlpA family protein disulfide reductase [Deltaproteobacteria bacterium]
MATAGQVLADDPVEQLFEQEVTDGLPVVPPTRERVERMLAGAPERERDELIGALGPCYGDATVEKIAINAVMAGCKPEYFPVVLAGVEGLCDERFCTHGLSVTLLSGAPLAIINGPVRRQIGLNCGHNALGHGFRANATIGRALRLVIMNIGGARPHGITKATMGHPGQYTFVVAEDEEASPLEPLHVERGFQRQDSV